MLLVLWRLCTGRANLEGAATVWRLRLFRRSPASYQRHCGRRQNPPFSSWQHWQLSSNSLSYIKHVDLLVQGFPRHRPIDVSDCVNASWFHTARWSKTDFWHVQFIHSDITRSSAIAEGPRDASGQLKSCQLPRNSAETTCTTSHEPSISFRELTRATKSCYRQRLTICAINYRAIVVERRSSEVLPT